MHKYICLVLFAITACITACQSFPEPPGAVNFGRQQETIIRDNANNRTYINYRLGYIEVTGTPGNHRYKYFFGRTIDNQFTVTLIDRETLLATQRTDIERNPHEGNINNVIPENELDALVEKFKAANAKAYDNGIVLGLSSRGIYYVESYGFILQDFWWGDGTLIDGITNRAYLVYDIASQEVHPVVEFASPFVTNILTLGAPVTNIGSHTFTLFGNEVSYEKCQLFQNGFIYSEHTRNQFVRTGGIYNSADNSYVYAPVFVPGEFGTFIERFTVGDTIYSNYQYGTIAATPDFIGYKDRIYAGRRYTAGRSLQLINGSLEHFLAAIDRAVVYGDYNRTQQTTMKNALKARYTESWNAGYSLGVPDPRIVDWDGIFGMGFYWGDSTADPFLSVSYDHRHGVSTIHVSLEDSAENPKTFLLSDGMLELWVKVLKLPFFPLEQVHPTGESQAMGRYNFQAFKGRQFDGYLIIKDNHWQSFAYTQLSINDWLAEQAKLEAMTGSGGIRASSLVQQNRLRGEQLLRSVADKFWYPETLIANQYWDIHTRDKDSNDTIADIWHYGTFYEAVLWNLEIDPDSAYLQKLERDLYDGLAYYEEYRDDDWTIYYLWYAGAPKILPKNVSQVDDNSVVATNFIHKYRIDNAATKELEQAKGIMEWIFKEGWDRSINPVTGEEFGGNDQGFAARAIGAYYKPICANEIVLTNILQFIELSDDPEEIAYYMEWAHKYYDFCVDTYLLDSGMFGDYIGCVRENDVTLSHGPLAADMYTYHQGAMMEAGVRMYHATGDVTYLEQAKKTARATHDYFGRRDIVPGYWQPDFNIYHWFNILQLRGYMMLAQVNEECRTEFDPYVQEWQRSVDYAYENHYLDGLLPPLFVQGWIYDNPFHNYMNIMDSSAYAQYYFMLSLYADGKAIH